MLLLLLSGAGTGTVVAPPAGPTQLGATVVLRGPDGGTATPNGPTGGTFGAA